jgi:hypothetical protein
MESAKNYLISKNFLSTTFTRTYSFFIYDLTLNKDLLVLEAVLPSGEQKTLDLVIEYSPIFMFIAPEEEKKLLLQSTKKKEEVGQKKDKSITQKSLARRTIAKEKMTLILGLQNRLKSL